MNCLDCGAAMELAGNRRHFRCTHCGNFHFPEEFGDGVSPLGDPAGCDCPVCHLPLQNALIDGEAVGYCDRCRGFLAVTAKFGQLVIKRRQHHGAHEQITDPFDRAELQHVIQCPGCQKRMDTHPYFGGGNAVVDTCERCGLIWLDAGELPIIERYIPHVRQIEPPLNIAPIQRREPAYESSLDDPVDFLLDMAWGDD